MANRGTELLCHSRQLLAGGDMGWQLLTGTDSHRKTCQLTQGPSLSCAF